MNVDELERLAEMVQNANIVELTLKQGANRLTLRKAPAPEFSGAGNALVVYSGPESEEGAETQTAGQGTASDNAAAPEPEIVMVNAPLVGIFRNVKPLVGLGAHVREGQTIGIIEAMKLFNEIYAPTDGRIVDVLVEDGMPVEYGHELFALEPGEAK